MRQISPEQIAQKIRAENPWWVNGEVGGEPGRWPPRAYLELFLPLVQEPEIRRAVVLMGPRRVGKTFLIHHTIGRLLISGVAPMQITYISVDHPVYTGLGLEQLISAAENAAGTSSSETARYVFFDEIQYLRDWEVHLKSLVDSRPDLRIIASGSAAAALRLKSQESGAGRFTDFLLPPLTFYEYLELLDEGGLVVTIPDGRGGEFFYATDQERLNHQFVQYLNFGGYPEVALSETIRQDPGRFIKSDIIDKVLLRDLPSLYGIGDIQELNYLFSTLAFNTAQEVSLEELSQNSGVSKNTLKRYIEYLEAAFLIKVIHRVDRSAKRFKRARAFKVYLTNPSMRSALFSPVAPDSEGMGAMAETAIFSQWFHVEHLRLNYARWDDGEVDIVGNAGDPEGMWAVEVKWSDRYVSRPNELKALNGFSAKNGIGHALVTTRTVTASARSAGALAISFLPASVYCYLLGYNIIHSKRDDWVRFHVRGATAGGPEAP